MRIPDSLQIVYKNRIYDGAELRLRSRSFAEAFRQRQLNCGDRVLVLLLHPLGVTAVFLACLHSGIIFVPCSLRWTERELANALGLVKPALIVAEPTMTQIPATDIPRLAPGDLAELSPATGYPAETVDPNRDCALLFTSGTTGLPRAVRLTWRNFTASTAGWHERLHFTKEDHYLNCLPLQHAGGLGILTRALLSGFRVTVTDNFNSSHINDLIDNAGVTLISLVPTQLQRLLDDRGESAFPGHLRALVLGGGPVPVNLLERCRARGVPVFLTYGLTETCSGIAGWWLHEHPEGSPGCVGSPFQNVSLQVEKNEIVVEGPMVMQGYWGDKNLNGEFYTGDFAHRDADGCVVLDLRREDRIVTGGENVNPREVEEVLLSHPLIEDCTVLGQADEHWGQRVVACIAGRNLPAAGPQLRGLLVAFCKLSLADYKIPREFKVLPEIPRNEMGKVIRCEL